MAALMKTLKILALVMLLVSIPVLLLVGQETRSESESADSVTINWIQLFNGKDLTGWSQKNGSAGYEVVDGTIMGTTSDGSPNSFLCTKQHFADFELEFEVKLLEASKHNEYKKVDKPITHFSAYISVPLEEVLKKNQDH